MLIIHKNLAELKLNYNWEGKPDVLGKINVPVLLRPPQIPDVLSWYRSRVLLVESLSYGHCHALPNLLNIYNCYIFLITFHNIGTETLKNWSLRLLWVLHVPWFETPLYIRISIMSNIAKEHDLSSKRCLQFLCLCAPYVLRSVCRCFKVLFNDAVNHCEYTASVR